MTIGISDHINNVSDVLEFQARKKCERISLLHMYRALFSIDFNITKTENGYSNCIGDTWASTMLFKYQIL